jgi:hypothetical protein
MARASQIVSMRNDCQFVIACEMVHDSELPGEILCAVS